MNNNKTQNIVFFRFQLTEKLIEGLLLAALMILIVFSLGIGRYPLSVMQIMSALSSGYIQEDNTSNLIINIIRLPRIAGVVLSGIGLGLAGAAMQGIFRNPLVGPEVSGICSGASFGGVLALMFSLPMIAIVSMAFCFGLLALVFAMFLAKLTKNNSVLPIILAGVIIGAFFSSLTGLMQYFADPQTQLPSIVYWLMGSFVGITYEKITILLVVTLICGTLLLFLRWRINLLSLDEVDASVLGVNITKLRWGVISLCAFLVATQTSISGSVGFVGLIVPHLSRLLVGPEHSRLLPVSACIGAIYLLAMDDIARTITDQEIPIGLLTSFIGAPIFGWLFWRMQARGWSNE
ncbi:FecCD family ABC transporter permease [Escherichia albertii]|uniref:FecCD family ABC transporter permease n=1 Tax=Escherichia albertii TaxID=208962 RepID=UPI0002BA6B02|nr:iron chelate uptake ABC transporter family permease subunit [Escherichia albertii]CTU99864.1 ABC transporter permease [Escherichia coli]EFF0781050.1 iron ABC transporter permease [Escherichia albertii]EFF0796979.1 iron ABC transporter permease [Escherichia albertii]EHG7528774.1 iron ABC transporter permease [Escherichia albertii]EJM0810295.1 iron ABC transporter permease [Escherichia albertii]